MQKVLNELKKKINPQHIKIAHYYCNNGMARERLLKQFRFIDSDLDVVNISLGYMAESKNKGGKDAYTGITDCNICFGGQIITARSVACSKDNPCKKTGYQMALRRALKKLAINLGVITIGIDGEKNKVHYDVLNKYEDFSYERLNEKLKEVI